MRTFKNRTFFSPYNSIVEWILKHITAVYAIEILLAVMLCLYGIISEHGFSACG